MKNRTNKAHQRLEQAVRDKLNKGWNAFSRDEVSALFELLQESRRAKTALYQRIHTAHGDAVGWHLDGDIGLHERRPAPEGARNLFEKPPRLDFARGWRIPQGHRIHGFRRTADGTLISTRSHALREFSPNDLIRDLHHSLNDLSSSYRALQNTPVEDPCSESEGSQ